MIKQLTFTAEDMRSFATKCLENAMADITEADYYKDGPNAYSAMLDAAAHWGKATAWLDQLSDIGIELAGENEHVETMLQIVEEKLGLCY